MLRVLFSFFFLPLLHHFVSIDMIIGCRLIEKIEIVTNNKN